LQPGGGVRVAIFNRSTGNIIPGLDVTIAGTEGTLEGNHRIKNITPVLLPPGNYAVVAKGYNETEHNGNSYSGGGPYTAGNTGGGAISFSNEASYGPDNPDGFGYPASSVNVGDAHLFLAGTFKFTKDVTCPPPVVTRVIPTTTTETAKQPAKENMPVLTVKTKDVKIYPNPTNGQFSVQLQGISGEKVNIQIINSNGRMVEQKTIGVTAKAGTMLVPFNLNNQPAGIYLVKVESADGIQTGKIVIGR
jgi:Secretion system C-terminal sorting domain